MKLSSISTTAGIIFIILGLVSIAYPLYSSLGMEVLLGALFLAGGIFQLFGAFEEKHRKNIIWDFCIGVLYILAGVYLLSNPIGGLLSLTLVLIILFYLQGSLTILSAVSQFQGGQRFWAIVSGLCALGVATILTLAYPLSALWSLGLLVGINLFFFGLSILLVNRVLTEGDGK